MLKHRSRYLAVSVLALMSGCATANKDLYPPSALDETCTVYVVSNGWHAGIVIPRRCVSDDIWPEQLELPPSQYAEIGWGSKEFYMASRITPAIVVRTLLWPSSSVLHVACFDGPPELVFEGADLIPIRLSERGFRELCRHIHESYELNGRGLPICLGPGLYGESRFYRARGKYYFPNTCNAWTARALRGSGCPIAPAYCATAQGVVLQAKRFGEPPASPRFTSR
jgi:uncharacterized protein (TIGR02117 family)